MPEKTKKNRQNHEELNVKDTISKEKNTGRAVTWGVLLAFGLVIYVIVAYKELWLGTINRLDFFFKGKNQNEQQELISTEASTDASNKSEINGCFPENTQELLKFAPDEKELDSLHDIEHLNPYDQDIEETTDHNNQSLSSVNLINDFNDYRIYLLNVNEFLRKFSKDQVYSENLDLITQIELPKEFEEIISMCKSYNEMLVTNALSHTKISLFKADIFDKFLKITKETNSYKEMKKLKAQIENRIDLFAAYLFSSELLQEEFLE